MLSGGIYIAPPYLIAKPEKYQRSFKNQENGFK